MTVTRFHARPNLNFTQQDPTQQLRQTAEVVNRINGGQFNCSLLLTLTANAATTTITDPRISAQTYIGLMPTTANAAAALATTYIVCVNGSATVNHTNNAQTDKTFVIAMIG